MLRTLRSGRYIDKSLFIKDILECNDKLMLITYPLKWYKSTNIDMLTRFLRIESGDSSFFKKYRRCLSCDQIELFKTGYQLKINNKKKEKSLQILKH
jgi:hypothetical protein